jgi:hypothetical protein
MRLFRPRAVSTLNTGCLFPIPVLRMGYELTPSEAKKLEIRNRELHQMRILQLKQLVTSEEYEVTPEEIADGMLKDDKFSRSWH